uniref:Aminoglycoside phosphotransferase domain-containing protein n=1 Tax=Mycena chlorophos TaxID=658473 RepID=A0ABQ0LQ24_MYCCL|nr:predicted protein [Mycena chlorophos]
MSIPQRRCPAPGCESKGYQAVAWYCEACDEVFCEVHDATHGCGVPGDDEYWDRTMQTRSIILHKFLNGLDLRALTKRASVLNGGCECLPIDKDTLDETLMSGGQHFLVPLDFRTGERWLARFQRPSNQRPSPAMCQQALLSEVAVYKFLASIDFPVPKIFDYAMNEEHSYGIGYGYILMEQMNGFPLSSIFDGASQETRTKILREAAALQVKLAAHPFHAIGALHEPDAPQVGTLTLSWLDAEFEQPSLGPFAHSSEFWEACLHNTWSSQAGVADIDAYLGFLFMREAVAAMIPSDTSSDSGNPQFILRHLDDKGDHILIDDDNNIVAVIDWEYSWIVPKELGLTAPLWVGEDIGINDEYSLQICPAEREFASFLRDEFARPDLAVLAETGRKYYYLHRACGAVLGSNDFCDHDVPTLLRALGSQTASWEEWKTAALERYADDEKLCDLRERQSLV